MPTTSFSTALAAAWEPSREPAPRSRYPIPPPRKSPGQLPQRVHPRLPPSTSGYLQETKRLTLSQPTSVHDWEKWGRFYPMLIKQNTTPSLTIVNDPGSLSATPASYAIAV